MDDKELDQMAKDIEPGEIETEPTKTDAPVVDAPPTGFVEDKETYVKPDGETTTTPTRNLIKEESGAKKWVMGSLLTVVILGLGSATAWAYMDGQNARNELQSVKTGLDAARTDAAKLRADATKPAVEEVKGEDFAAFSKEYDKMLEASAELTEADETAIETSLKTHYKLTTLPEGWQIVTGYKDAKADATTGKPVNALVLWPATNDKPAGFFEMNQDPDTGKWRYNDLR